MTCEGEVLIFVQLIASLTNADLGSGLVRANLIPWSLKKQSDIGYDISFRIYTPCDLTASYIVIAI